MAHRILIYQIGRLDTNAFQKQSFNIGGKEYASVLSSFALREFIHSKDEKAEVYLIYPISLPFNKALLKSKQLAEDVPIGFLKKISDILSNPMQYLEKPAEFFASHPHNSEATKFTMIHSIGSFETNSTDYPTVFLNKCYYSDIVLEILNLVIKDFVDNQKVERVIFDISSGQNVYVLALTEAARYFCAWLNDQAHLPL